MGWRNPRWNSLRGPDAEVLRSIFQSLQDFLDDPEFTRGVRIGDGSPPSYDPILDVITPPSTVRIDGGNSAAPPSLDTTPPAAAPTGITVRPGPRGLLVYWNQNQDDDVVDGRGSYEVQIHTDIGFGEGTRTVFVAANLVTFNDLAVETTYWIRVRAVDAAGNKGPWSAAVDSIPDSIQADDLAEGAVGTREIADFAVVVKKFNTGTHQIY